MSPERNHAGEGSPSPPSSSPLPSLLIQRPILVLAILGLPIFLANYFAGHPGISGWDANFYYSYAAALADAGTLDLERTYDQMLARGGDPDVFNSAKRTPTGQVYNSYPIGHPVTHTPAAFLGKLVARLTEGAATPFGPTAQLFYCLSCILGAAIGCELMRRLIARWYSAEAAAVSIYTLAACSMLGYYWFVLPALSHTTTILMMGLIVWLFVRLADGHGRWPTLLALGAAIGWSGVVRLQDLGNGAFGLLALWLIAREQASLKDKFKRAAALIAGGLAALAPQLLHWRWKDGTWLPRSYNDYSHFSLSDPHFLEVLFSPRHGLFLWHPILLLAAGGAAAALYQRRQERPFALTQSALFTAFTTIWALGAFYSIWWFGDSLGSRPFLTVLPLFWVGLAHVYTAARARRAWLAALAGLVLLLAAANAALALAFHLSWISRSGPLF